MHVTRPSWLTRDRLFRLALTVAIAVMLIRAIRIFIQYSNLPIDWDALGYRGLVGAMKHPYDTSGREPVWINLVWLGELLFGPTDQSLRVLCTLLFIATAGVLYRLTREISGSRLAALIAFILITNHGYLGLLAVRGLRDNLQMLGTVALAYVLFARPRWLTERLRLVAWAGAGLLMAGTRLSLLAPLVPLFALGAWRLRIRWWKAALAFGAVLGLLAPYLVYCQLRFGDPMFATNNHAAHWRNVEFVRVRGIGCPGCPTVEEMGPPAFLLGEPTTAAKYLLGMHSVAELAVGSAKGYFELLVWPAQLNVGHARPMAILRVILCWWGVALLLHRRRAWVLAVPLLSMNLLAYLAPFRDDPRFFVDIIPFQIMAVGVGAAWVCERIETYGIALARRFQPRRRPSGLAEERPATHTRFDIDGGRPTP
jgi:hypothetical protein